jgi:NTE family protein
LDEQVKYNCIFGGGGIRGMCYIGAVKALQEYNIKIETIAGSSVGAVFAALLAVGYNVDEIKEFFFEFNLNMFRDLNISIFNNDLSLSKGEIFLDWIREKIERKIYQEEYENKKGEKVKFKDIDKDLQILTVDINTNTPYIFSKQNTPDYEIAYAVRASACLPGLMKSIIEDDKILVDGDLIKTWAGFEIYKDITKNPERILEFRLEGSRNVTDIKNPMDYVNSLINTIWYLSTENVYNKYHNNDKCDFIVFDIKDVILFDFTIDRDEKEKLITKGYEITKEYLTNTLLKKKEIIKSIYKRILNKLQHLKKLINSNKLKEVEFLINEILSTMVEDKIYIDETIYEQLKNLKEIINISKKKQFLFSEKLNNIETIKTKCELIENVTNKKLQEINTYIKTICNNC